MQRSRSVHRGRTAIAGVVFALASPLAWAGDVRTIEIEATEFTFEPSSIEVEQGETVRLKLVNAGNISHNLHLHGVEAKTETVQAGNSDTIEFTAQDSGTVRFFCNVPGHKQAGMKGRVLVE